MSQQRTNLGIKLSFRQMRTQNIADGTLLSLELNSEGKDVGKTYQQKVKNGSVNFYGESFQLQTESSELSIKVIDCSVQGSSKALTVFRISFSVFEKDKINSGICQSQGRTLLWESESIGADTEDESNFLQSTSLNFSEIKHPLYSTTMYERMEKRSFSVLEKDSTDQEETNSGKSSITIRV